MTNNHKRNAILIRAHKTVVRLQLHLYMVCVYVICPIFIEFFKLFMFGLTSTSFKSPLILSGLKIYVNIFDVLSTIFFFIEKEVRRNYKSLFSCRGRKSFEKQNEVFS